MRLDDLLWFGAVLILGRAWGWLCDWARERRIRINERGKA